MVATPPLLVSVIHTVTTYTSSRCSSFGTMGGERDESQLVSHYPGILYRVVGNAARRLRQCR